MFEMRSLLRAVVNLKNIPLASQPSAGMKYFKPPPPLRTVEFPERAKLKYLDRVPQYPPGIRPPKMQKRLRYMRGPERLHNKFMHGQYGIVATGGGRLRWGHMEMIRLAIGRSLDTKRMFAEWRIDPPWQPLTKKGQGQRMGGGKGAIDHYVTPIKAGRVIVEIGGYCEYVEVKKALEKVAHKLPFKAMATSQEKMEKEARKEKYLERINANPWTFKYIIQNNLGGCNRWLSPFDKIWYGKYL